MSPHAPPHLQAIAPVLLAGEDVRYMSKPNLMILLALESVVAAASFVVLWLFMTLFSDLPLAMKLAFSAMAAVLGVAILHITIGARTYVVTDQRLIIVASITHEAHDSCELADIISYSCPRFSHSLIVERRGGKPLRLWAVNDQDELEKILKAPEAPPAA